ncbi:MAG: imidazoleglycerol-phosphate dehydratase HisB [Elusimicrobiota bacterium]
MAKRTSEEKRKTTETSINLTLNLDGKGTAKITTGISFLDHMLTLFARHGLFDLLIKAKGDIEVDEHHLIEDMGIVLGSAIKKALGKKAGIKRYGFGCIPMDDSLVEASIDLSGRPYLVYNMLGKGIPKNEKERYELFEHFFYSLVMHSGMALHLNLRYGNNFHHNMEGAFKAFARALCEAVTKDVRVKGVPSTKGKL